MAAQSFEEIIAEAKTQFSAEEQKVFDNALAKLPKLKEGFLRQDDYSRKQNELAEERKQVAEKLTYADQMKDWAEVNVPRYNHLVEVGIIDKETGDELWTSKEADYKRQLDEANAKIVAGGDMDPKELESRVKEIVKQAGPVSKEELAAIVKSEAQALVKESLAAELATRETHFNEKTIPYVAGFSTGVAVFAAKYEKETGKPFTIDTQKEFFNLMSEKKNFDPYAVGDEFLRPIRSKREQDEEVERRVAAELAKRGVDGGGRETFIPTPQEKGNLQKMLEADDKGTDFESMIMNNARKAASELRTEGKV